jgi:hypothetical protein
MAVISATGETEAGLQFDTSPGKKMLFQKQTRHGGTHYNPMGGGGRFSLRPGQAKVV